jgi:hypothetical protein
MLAQMLTSVRAGAGACRSNAPRLLATFHGLFVAGIIDGREEPRMTNHEKTWPRVALANSRSLAHFDSLFGFLCLRLLDGHANGKASALRISRDELARDGWCPSAGVIGPARFALGHGTGAAR